MRKSAFNLVEILVAMAILTIGMVGLIGFLPVSISSVINAKSVILASQVANNFSEYVDADIQSMTSSPGKFSLTLIDAKYDKNSSPTANYSSSASNATTGWVDAKAADYVSSVLVTDHPIWGTVSSTSKKGVFKIDKKITLTNGSVVDFPCVAYVWYCSGADQTYVTRYIGANGYWVAAPPANGNLLRMSIEVTWPADQSPEKNRASGRSIVLQRFMRAR